MVATAEIRAPAAETTTVAAGPTAGIRSPFAGVTTIFNIPTAQIRASGFVTTSLTKTTNTVRVSQAVVTSIVKGRIDNRKVRSWWFSQDGHDFYVLRLGDTRTLVYDLTTDTWSHWSDPDTEYWRPQCGMNWLDMANPSFTIDGATSNAICGDDNFGLLWVIEPELGYDEAPRTDLNDAPFPRKVVGGVLQRLRDTTKVGAVYVTMNLGEPQFTGAGITLRTSVDNGQNWLDHGTITIDPGNYDQEIVWRALGLIRAPGMIFEISDNGAADRIDSLDMR